MISISKTNRIIRGEISLPPSKSISNRLLLLNFYYNNSLRIHNLSASDDTVLLSSILDNIGRYKLKGDSGLLRIDARNAGSVMRFLVPLLSITKGHFFLTGDERMKHRPIGALVEAMRANGADIDYLEKIGFPPLLIRGRAISFDRISLDASASSQFVTALLLLAPTLSDGLSVELLSKAVSWPYINMTNRILTSLGVNMVTQENSIRVFHKREVSTDVTVEADWSAASFWYSMLSLADKGEIYMPGLKKTGTQGDQEVSGIFAQLGVKTLEEGQGIRIVKTKIEEGDIFVDFTDHPDLALPVILACCASGKPGTFSGLDRLMIKESDRLEAISSGLDLAGIQLREAYPGTWRIEGHLAKPGGLFIKDFNDHRVAMTFAGLAIKGFTIHLDHPDVVNKSYPGFWNDLEKVGFAFSQ